MRLTDFVESRTTTCVISHEQASRIISVFDLLLLVFYKRSTEESMPIFLFYL